MTIFNIKGNRLTWIVPCGLPPKAKLDGRKVMQYVWRDPPRYYSFWVFKLQLDAQCRLILSTAPTYAWKSSKKTPCIRQLEKCVFHDKAEPYSTRIIQEKYMVLGWSVLPHPPHLTDFTPSDFYLFRSLQNALNNQKKLFQEDQVKMFVEISSSGNQLNFTSE